MTAPTQQLSRSFQKEVVGIYTSEEGKGSQQREIAAAPVVVVVVVRVSSSHPPQSTDTGSDILILRS
jgi:hypothetical protein